MMRTLFTLLSLMIWGHASLAQNIAFDYDAGGNRILRKPSEALPVTLVSFKVEKSAANVDGNRRDMALLSWQTSAEVNAAIFSVQRSQNGTKWIEIGNVLATGNFNQNDEIFANDYSFVDKIPAEGENLYRLKMIDRDNTFAYSQVRHLNFESEIFAYPNPVSSMLNLKWASLHSVQMFNIAGKLVFEAAKNVRTINVKALPVGVYILKLVGKDGSNIIKKIVKE